MNYVFMFGIPVTAFSHATTARAQYKCCIVVKNQEILTPLQQLYVSIYIYLKGCFCYQRGIESIRQPLQKGCLSYKKHTLRRQGATEANDNSNEREFFNVPLTARSYGGMDLGFKSHMKEAWDRTHDPWLTRRAALPLHHRRTLSQYFNQLNV